MDLLLGSERFVLVAEKLKYIMMDFERVKVLIADFERRLRTGDTEF